MCTMKLDDGSTAEEACDTATRYDRDFMSGVLECDETGHGTRGSVRLRERQHEDVRVQQFAICCAETEYPAPPETEVMTGVKLQHGISVCRQA
jgi:hypothetical protein